jgi:adenine-specific DNA methylase
VIPRGCKRLAEVDFPIAVVSKHAAREKSIRHGHPSTLHLWWARRPLAACRSMLMTLLLPDPCDPHCPAEFKVKARDLLGKATGKIGSKDADLRSELLKFIGNFANWDNSGNRAFLEIGRGLVQAAYPEETPLVVDPFAGGGSIPLEALRLGCDAFASDLNPIACLINKVLLEDIPRHGPELAEELRRVGAEVKKAAEKEMAEFYPVDPDGARPIAYLWARTVRCEAPNCGAEIPLVRSFWLCKKAGRRRALRTKAVRPATGSPHVELEIFAPTTERDVRTGTVSGARATCVCCNTALHPDRVRAQLTIQRGGADVVFDGKGKRTGGATLLAVVRLRDSEPGRHYRQSSDADYIAIWKAQQRLKQIASKRDDGLNPIPDEVISFDEIRRISVPLYGMTTWGDLFSTRQKLALVTLTRLISGKTDVLNGALQTTLALAMGRAADQLSSLVRWLETIEAIASTFGRQALGMVWDFCETITTGDQSANFGAAIEWIAKVIEARPTSRTGQLENASATMHPLPDQTVRVWFTDPPYYDSVPYAHLSDFFYVWLRRCLPRSKMFAAAVTPKECEIVVDRPHSLSNSKKDVAWYQAGMQRAFAEGRRLLIESGIGCVVFAHKTTEGWESLLSGMISGGWTITGSWPIATERSVRVNALDTASLATSIHLVCRPRPEDASVGDWGQVLRELPKRVADWMNRLQEEGVRGADLVFACIGPALEIYSRYSKVVDAEEREIPLGGDPGARDTHKRGYLAYVWEVVGRAALEQVLGTAEAKARNGAAGALEEDARLTALFLWTLQATTQDSASLPATDEDDEDADSEDEDDEHTPSSKKKKGLTLPFDVARRFAQPLGIHLDAWEGRCIETEKGIVRLTPVLDRAVQLFGEDGAEETADRLERQRSGPIQGMLFPLDDEPPQLPIRGRKRKAGIDVSDESLQRHRRATTLDHVHAAMLLQSAGRANALRALLKSEIERGPDFLRLANALSALYPKDSDEKRLLDAMLLAVPR